MEKVIIRAGSAVRGMRFLPGVFAALLGIAAGSGVHAGQGGTCLAWNAHSDVDEWCRAFGRFVADGDFVLITEGNGGKPADPGRAADKFRKVSGFLAGRMDIHYGVYTSGLDNVKKLASGLAGEKRIEFIGYGYEPGYAREFPKEPEGGWVFKTALANASKAARMVNKSGKRLMVIPTGRPLLEEEVKKYGWNYPDFLTRAGADLMLVQTQTFVYSSEFADAVKELDGQIGTDGTLRDRIILQMTIEPDRVANRNGVSPEAGYETVLEARVRGYRMMSLWHAYRDLDSAYAFLKMAGRDGPRAVPTFECLGLYWSPPEGSAEAACQVGYRTPGSPDWKEALPLWFDPRNREYRGSIVGLKPGTRYEVRLSLPAVSATLAASTWSERFPVSATVYVPAGVSRRTFEAREPGTVQGYVLYAAPPGGSATIDMENGDDFCVNVTASYVIVRGLVLKGARKHAVELGPGVHDVVIEECDISGWGRVAEDGFAVEHDAGIRAKYSDVGRIVIQRNRIHDPRGNSNDWSQKRVITRESYHPCGPQAVVFYDNEGNNVIRYNSVWSDESHRYNDGIGGAENFSTRGFPGPDSDVYGNMVANVTDDALEIEGGGRNVRVWGNYLDMTFTGIASAACALGPLYIFRNVMDRSREYSFKNTDTDGRGWFGKLGDEGLYAHGRRCFFHNISLQRPAPGKKYPLGAWGGPSPCGDDEPMSNTVSLNNIWHTYRDDKYFCEDGHRDATNLFDHDLYNGRLKAYAGAEPHGVHAVPVYRSGNGDTAGDSGKYRLAPGSPGYDAGTRIPDFNDGFTGAGPDVGAHEDGTRNLEFGVNAYRR